MNGKTCSVASGWDVALWSPIQQLDQRGRVRDGNATADRPTAAGARQTHHEECRRERRQQDGQHRREALRAEGDIGVNRQ